MLITKEQLIPVLSKFNPWWKGDVQTTPEWRRASFDEIFTWVYNPPTHRAVLISGARQIGKTTLVLQTIKSLIEKGIPAADILYITFDHPIIKLAGIDLVLEAWREHEPKKGSIEYLFLDEAQFIPDWGTWIKHQVDFNKERRIVFTGSSMPLLGTKQESGVGRWHIIRLATLSFYEYLYINQFYSPQINAIIKKFEQEASIHGPSLKSLIEEAISQKKILQESLPKIKSLRELFDWSPQQFNQVTEKARPFIGYFHEYLVRGGFPQTAQMEDINQAQRLLREDIIDKVLKRDMTALFGVRNILELERTFLYLCMHDGGLLDMQNLTQNLEVKRPTAQHFIELLEAAHLIYRLQPFGYGKEILRAKYKIYLADPAIVPAVLLKGKGLLGDAEALGAAAEAAVFKHLSIGCYQYGVRFAYWHGKKDHEVDLVAEIGDQIIPFEVKYRAQHMGVRELKGLLEFCKNKKVDYGYVVTKSLDDFGLLPDSQTLKTRIMRIPATLLCYWLGENEANKQNPIN